MKRRRWLLSITHEPRGLVIVSGRLLSFRWRRACF